MGGQADTCYIITKVKDCRSVLVMAAAVKFGRHVKELRVHLCQTSAASQGVRNFIENHYVDLKKANLKKPILIRECSGVQPKVWARYEMGEEACRDAANLSEQEVANLVASLVK